MAMTAFIFNPAIDGCSEMADTWVFGDRDQEFISDLRTRGQELTHWPDAHLMAGWGAYSQDIMAVSWVGPEQFNIEAMYQGFLAYLYVRQLAPHFDFLGTGLFSDDVFDLGEMKPWLGDKHTASVWAQP